MADKESSKCQIIDVIVLYDIRMDSEILKNKYQDLARGLKTLWNIIVEVIPVVVNALGTAPKELKERLGKIGIENKNVDLQKTTKIYSEKIP